SFPEQILDDNADVRGYAGGVAFHCYGGDPSQMDLVHDAHPDKDIYVTECSGGSWSGSFGDSLQSQGDQLYIGAVRHWAKSMARACCSCSTPRATRSRSPSSRAGGRSPRSCPPAPSPPSPGADGFCRRCSV